MALKLQYFQEALLQLSSPSIQSPRFLLAVSGGLDSMVLTDLFSRSQWSFAIAHCNFQLRGAASDQDALFVQQAAEALGITHYSKDFPTQSFASTHKLSIQDAARQLRYEWLEEIRQKHDFDFLVTAHHLDDSLETFLFNFAKGSGLKGLLGIPPKNGVIVRPLLGFSRSELEIYYQRRKLQHREDASNASDHYDRNKIRLQIVPVLQEINPSLLASVAANLQHLKDSYLLFQAQVNQLKKGMVVKQDQGMQIQISPLMNHMARKTLLYEWLHPFGFHSNQIPQILDCIHRQKTGALFYAKNHRLLVDREQLLVEPISVEEARSYTIAKPERTLILPEGTLAFKLIPTPEEFSKDPKIAYLALEQLSFPLTLRKWQAGDQFCPLGMNGQHKKVQDLLSDLKINRFEKEKVWILENGNQEICWVLGLRLDDRYKIQSTDQQCLQVIFQGHY